MAGDTGLNPGDVDWVAGVKDACRTATCKVRFNPTEARRWLTAQGFTVYRLPAPVETLAIATEEP